MVTRSPRCAVLIPAFNEEQRIGRTVKAALSLPLCDVVVVIDDCSSDSTGSVASSAGARVVRHLQRRGKGAALETGVAFVREVDQKDQVPLGRLWFFLDADLGESAAQASPLIESLDRDADLTIAVLPASIGAGGFGLAVRLSRWGVRILTGWTPKQPLSGQRCLTTPALDAAQPLAKGFGIETAMTIDLVNQGFRVKEVNVPMRHRVTGQDWRSHLHRARQFGGIARALAPRIIRGRRSNESEQALILYDDDCGFCRWVVIKILAMDRRRHLRPVALQDRETDIHLAVMSSEQRFDSWHLVRDGRIYSAGAGIAPLARMFRYGLPIAVLAEMFPGLFERLYRLVANRRNWFGSKLGLGPQSCRIERDSERAP